jgi:ABC-2 type transport system ATP-binding protein
MEMVIRMRGVVRSFGGTRALDGLDLEVPRGSLLALLGPNGAGKTTTMKLLVGLLAADAGEVDVLGWDPWRMPRHERKRIGYLSEQDFPFPEFDLVGATRFVSSFFPSWDSALLETLATTLRIPSSRRYSDLSRGEQRKFHLALTLAPRPELLLLDDPAQGLDVMTRRDFMRSILPLLQDSRCNVVLSTHILSDVERFADRVAIVRAGKVVVHDEIDELKRRVQQVVVSAGEPTRLRGAVRATRRGGELAYTVLDADPVQLAELKARSALIDVSPLSFEDLFIDLASPDSRVEEPVRG